MTAEDDNKKAPASEEKKLTKKDDEVKIYSSDNVKDAALRKEAESREERRGGFFDKLFKKR